jgi:hypothetical protein
MDRYKPMLSCAWIGSRNIGNNELVSMVARLDPKLPLGVKNTMDGATDHALAQIERVNSLRESAEAPAPAVLIFRGGHELDTPGKWEKAYLRALEITDGQLIVDTAHGSEMAHDPDKKFRKSVAGQVAAMEAVIRLAEQGHPPAGIMLEASDIDSPTDPVMPLETAIEGVKRLHWLKSGQTGTPTPSKKITV